VGFALSWLTVRDQAIDHVCEMLDIQQTMEREEAPESAFTGIRLPTGWYSIIANRHVPRWFQDTWFRKLSQSTTVIAASVEEHVMYSSAEQWDAGRVVWTITHNSDEGRRHLEITGDLPEVFESIRERQFARQAADDAEDVRVDHIFDIPVDVVEALTGFRYDVDLGLADNPFEVLKDAHKSFAAKLLDRIFRRA
jgi:hypothetical protein